MTDQHEGGKMSRQGFDKVAPPRGMLEYATSLDPYYVTFKGAGPSKGSNDPLRVYSSYSRERKVSVVGRGAIRVERITGHYHKKGRIAS